MFPVLCMKSRNYPPEGVVTGLTACQTLEMVGRFTFISARNSSCGKVIFVQVSVCPGVYPIMQCNIGVCISNAMGLYPRMQWGRGGGCGRQGVN